MGALFWVLGGVIFFLEAGVRLGAWHLRHHGREKDGDLAPSPVLGIQRSEACLPPFLGIFREGPWEAGPITWPVVSGVTVGLCLDLEKV